MKKKKKRSPRAGALGRRRPTRARVPLAPAPDTRAASEPVRIPLLAEGADPGRTLPSPFAVRDSLLVDSSLVQDRDPSRLFAYEVTMRDMRHLRGLAVPGDRYVFYRGGAVAADRVCAVRTPWGVVLSRVRFKGRSVLLLPGEGHRAVDAVGVDDLKALPGVIAGTHVLLIPRAAVPH